MKGAAKETRWGYPLQVWEAARSQARAELLARARSRETVAYSELCDAITAGRFRPYSWAFMALVDDVCRDEDAAHGVILASLVVRKDTRMPGEGYFAWAERSGLDVSDRGSCWQREAAKVWDAYA